MGPILIQVPLATPTLMRRAPYLQHQHPVHVMLQAPVLDTLGIQGMMLIWRATVLTNE